MAGCCLLQKQKVIIIEWFNYLTTCILVSTVTLDSSSDSVCPGDTVVFTCATDTGELIWDIDENQFYFSTSQVPNVYPSFPFKFSLISTQGANIITTATVDNVQLDDNGTVITCADNSIHQLANIATIELVISVPSGPIKCKTMNNSFTCFCRASYSTIQFEILF